MGALALASLCWSSLAWSQCPNDTVRAALRVCACLAVFVVMASVAMYKPAKFWVAVGLSLGVMTSALPAVCQQAGGMLSPECWVDPAFRGVIQSRVCGPTDNPNVYAGYLAYALPLCMAMAVSLPTYLGWLCSAASAIGAGCLLLTYSRSGWLGAVVGGILLLAAVAWRHEWQRVARLLPLVALVAVVMALYPQAVCLRATHVPRMEEGTLEHRLFMWRAGLQMLRWHPLGGVGLGCYEACYPAACPREVMKPYALVRAPGSAHSDYMQTLSEMGLPAALLAGALLVGLARTLRRQRTNALGTSEALLRVGALGTFAAALASGIAQSNLQTPLCGVILAVSAALLVAGNSRGEVPCPMGHSNPAVRCCALAAGLLLVVAVGAGSWSGDLRAQAQEEAYARHIPAALDLVRRSLALAPLSSDLYCLIGDIHAASALDRPSGRELAEAEQAYRTSVALDPLSGVLQCKLADMLERRGDLAGAFKGYKRASELDWYKASYHLQVGRLASELKQAEVARAHLRTAVSLFRLEIALAMRRGEGDGWYTEVLQRAYSDAVLRYERVSRELAAPRKLTDGTSPCEESALLECLGQAGLRTRLTHVGVGAMGESLAAAVNVSVGDGKGRSLCVRQLETDALQAMRAAFGLSTRVYHVDFSAVMPTGDADDRLSQRALFSVSATRERFVRATADPGLDAQQRLALLGPLRYDPKLANLGLDGKAARANIPGAQYCSRTMRERWPEVVTSCQRAEKGYAVAAQARVLTGPVTGHQRRSVALTIDDGPYPLMTPLVLEALRQEGGHATFFVVGDRAEQYPGLLQEIVRSGSELACHTYSHRRFDQLTSAETFAEVKACCDVITAVSGRPPVYLRPPGGRQTKAGLAVAERLGLCTTFWSWNMGDWFGGAGETTDSANREVVSGDVILAHGADLDSLQALRRLLVRLRQQGLTAARLSDVCPYRSATIMPIDSALQQNPNLR